jgi:hypothetical protein
MEAGTGSMSEPNAQPDITTSARPIPLAASQLEYAAPGIKSGRSHVIYRQRLIIAFFAGSVFSAAAIMASEHFFQRGWPRDWALEDLRRIISNAILLSLASAVSFGVILRLKIFPPQRPQVRFASAIAFTAGLPILPVARMIADLTLSSDQYGSSRELIISIIVIVTMILYPVLVAWLIGRRSQ